MSMLEEEHPTVKVSARETSHIRSTSLCIKPQSRMNIQNTNNKNFDVISAFQSISLLQALFI